MVTERNYPGVYKEDALKRMQHSGVCLDNFSFLAFRIDPDDGRDRGIRQEISALYRLDQLPEFDRQSYLLRGLVDSQDHRVDILLVPKNCPRIDYRDHETGHRWNSQETHIISVRNRSNSEKVDWTVLNEDAMAARRIARGQVCSQKGWMREEVTTAVHKVTPAEFEKQVKALLVAGYRIPNWFLRFGDLQEFVNNLAQQKRTKSF